MATPIWKPYIHFSDYDDFTDDKSVVLEEMEYKRYEIIGDMMILICNFIHY